LSAALAQALPKQDLGETPNLAGGIVLGVAFAAYSIVITLFSREENRAAGSFSATTAIAGMLTFALGAYALLGDIRIAAGVAVAVTALLASREELHGWVEKITWPELRSVVVLLAMTFIALPILPNQPVGPFGGINLREVWIIAIVLASVSFLGYLAVKYFGARRGLLLAAAAGALASRLQPRSPSPMRVTLPPAKAPLGCLQPASQLPRRSCFCGSPALWPRSSPNSSCWSLPLCSPLR
jgi:uncharacterized membrane protein (DUF4010 family)